VRALITGASGFAGAHLAVACAAAGDQVIGISRRGDALAAPGSISGRSVDLLDAAAVQAVIGETRPEVVYHLAALSSVGRSWEDPARTVGENTATAVNLLEALRHEAPNARLVWVSSCEVYGTPARLPVAEDAPFAPVNPYAVSKTAGDLLAGVYADAHGLRIVRARPFNHAGPGQLPIFIVSSLARQAAEGRLAGAQTIRIVTGNPDTRRDFTDVRDVVRAYRLLAGGPPSEVYNVSSGRSVSAAEWVELLGELIAPIRIEHVVDPARVRAHEVMDLRGSHDRLTAATGWEPEIPLAQTMRDTIAWWEQRLSTPQSRTGGPTGGTSGVLSS
jgi:GDP-4-dehydro-6-deoxy-D-mannose reductase